MRPVGAALKKRRGQLDLIREAGGTAQISHLVPEPKALSLVFFVDNGTACG
jgi:hypothetical protein